MPDVTSETAKNDLSLDPVHIKAIQTTWKQISCGQDKAAESIKHYIRALAPGAQESLFQHGESLMSEVCSLLSEIHDESSTAQRLRALGSHPALKAMPPEHIPSVGRALLYGLWDMCEASGIRYTDEIAKGFSALWNLSEKALLPQLSAEEHRKLNYFHRKAPGSQIGVESREGLKALAQVNRMLEYTG